MRAAYLIARREYLSYVATWGFWLSLLAVPIFATIGGVTPALIQSSQPVRYFAVIDETGQGLDRLVEQARFEQRRAQVRGAIEMMAQGVGGDEAQGELLEEEGRVHRPVMRRSWLQARVDGARARFAAVGRGLRRVARGRRRGRRERAAHRRRR